MKRMLGRAYRMGAIAIASMIVLLTCATTAHAKDWTALEGWTGLRESDREAVEAARADIAAAVDDAFYGDVSLEDVRIDDALRVYQSPLFFAETPIDTLDQLMAHLSDAEYDYRLPVNVHTEHGDAVSVVTLVFGMGPREGQTYEPDTLKYLEDNAGKWHWSSLTDPTGYASFGPHHIEGKRAIIVDLGSQPRGPQAVCADAEGNLTELISIGGGDPVDYREAREDALAFLRPVKATNAINQAMVRIGAFLVVANTCVYATLGMLRIRKRKSGLLDWEAELTSHE